MESGQWGRILYHTSEIIQENNLENVKEGVGIKWKHTKT